MSRPATPLSVKRELRQEAHFGCAKCGNPILDYHHIIPWSERHHFEPEHMIALCPSCHRHIGKLSKNKAYALKSAPYNKTNKNFKGELGTDATITSFLVGSNTYTNTPIIFSYYGVSIISCTIIDGQVNISANILGRNWWPEIQIINNDIIANTAHFWDIEHRTNYLRFQKQNNTSFLEIDLRKQPALISMDLQFGKDTFKFSPEGTKLRNNITITNGGTKDCSVGIGYGSGKLHLPNHAMISPRPILELKSKLFEFVL